jgi:3-hydroxybutyryl-CoA dehydrogenase
MNNVAVIGAGTMGNGIAHVFAQFDHKVNLIDISEEALKKALETIEKNLDRQIRKEAITVSEKDRTLGNITTHTDLVEGVKGAKLVVEAASENSEVKKKIFRQIDEATDGKCILATNTSSISITEIAASTRHPENVIGMHFMNPVPVMRLVEIIKGYKTSEDIAHTITEISKKLNKVPVVVNDYPGFVSNRVLMPMINEAIYTLFEGVAGVEEIDTVMKLGMAHPMGPLQLADFIGLDVCHSILNVLHKGFGNQKYAPCPLLTNMVRSGNLGVKTGEGFYSWSHGTKDLIVASQFKNR